VSGDRQCRARAGERGGRGGHLSLAPGRARPECGPLPFFAAPRLPAPSPPPTSTHPALPHHSPFGAARAAVLAGALHGRGRDAGTSVRVEKKEGESAKEGIDSRADSFSSAPPSPSDARPQSNCLAGVDACDERVKGRGEVAGPRGRACSGVATCVRATPLADGGENDSALGRTEAASDLALCFFFRRGARAEESGRARTRGGLGHRPRARPDAPHRTSTRGARAPVPAAHARTRCPLAFSCRHPGPAPPA
jgi:hypothetical protein